VHSDLGHLEDATAAFDAAIRTDPDYAGAYSNLLLSLHYRAEVTGAAILAQARRFAARFEAPSRHFANTADPNRRLRIGYVSGDYCRHSVAYFLAPVLSHHDRTSVQVFCYSTGAKTDDMTERLQSGADQWRSLVGVSDEAGSKMVIADGIDVLVDLSGHTALNRLTLFARKAAPVQVSWLGYPGTTGLTAMDYRLVDVVSDPEDEDGTHTSETLIRLRDGFLCYGPPAEAPEPKMPEGCGYPVSFGSFNNLAKLSADTFEVWAALLDRVHGARLVLKGRPFADPAVRLLVRERFRERGVAPERVVLIEHLSATAEHLAAYNEVDIGLDPFPYNGTTTTCEALWMGVPVVTLRGDRHSGRVGASLLTQMGLEDLIARDTEDYLRIAVTLADDDKRRNELRRTLRARMAASSLCNGPAFARKLEEAYRKIWRDWCARQS